MKDKVSQNSVTVHLCSAILILERCLSPIMFVASFASLLDDVPSILTSSVSRVYKSIQHPNSISLCAHLPVRYEPRAICASYILQLVRKIQQLSTFLYLKVHTFGNARVMNEFFKKNYQVACDTFCHILSKSEVN